MEMIKITEDELKILFEKEKKNHGAANRLLNTLGKAVPPIVLIEGIYTLFLKYKFSYSFFLTFFLFLLADLVLLLMIPITCVFISCIKQVKQNGGNFFSAINMTRLSLKYQKLNKLHADEICSDKYIAEIDRLLQAEKNNCSACWLRSMKAFALFMQNRISEAEIIIAEQRSRITKKTELFIDLPLLEIDCADKKNDAEAFFAAIEAHHSYLELRKANEFNFALAYATICSNAEFFKKNYGNSLHYIELHEKYEESSGTLAAASSVPRKETNIHIYNRAAYALAKAKCYYFLGEYERASAELDTADVHIADLTCDIPNIYIKEHREILSMLREKFPLTE